MSPEDFGAVGDGVADDTAALQRALDTLKEVKGRPGAVYRVSRRPNSRRCLHWRSRMHWEGNGSTIKLADNQQPCSILEAEFAVAGGGAVADTIVRGRFDGNGARQGAIQNPPRPDWFTPTLYMSNCVRGAFNVQVVDAFIGAAYFQGALSDNNVGEFEVDGSRGFGVSVGGSRWTISRVSVKNTRHDESLIAHIQSNGFLYNGSGGRIGSVMLENCGWGVKVQDPTRGVRIESIVNRPGPGTAANQAVKIQASGGPVTDVYIGSISAEEFGAGGLYLVGCEGVTVASYNGRNNGSDTGLNVDARAEVYILSSTAVHIGNLLSDNPGLTTVVTDNGPCSFSVDRMEIRNMSAEYFGPIVCRTATRFQIGALRLHTTSSWGKYWAFAQGASVSGSIGSVEADIPGRNYATSGLPLFARPSSGDITTGSVVWPRGSPPPNIRRY